MDELLEMVELPDHGRRSVATLSGGEAQRVALARALGPATHGCSCSTSRSAPSTATCGTGWRPTYARCCTGWAPPPSTCTHDLAEAELVADRVVRLVADAGRSRHAALMAEPGRF